MIQITDWLYCGSGADVSEFLEDHPNGRIIHAAKDPWHRDLLGYTTRGAPKGDPEYLYALRGNELALNLVDSPKREYISDECFIKAAHYLNEWHGDDGGPVLVHCNQGHSRGPGVVFYDMIQHDMFDTCADFEEAVEHFIDNYYTDFNPGNGVREFLKETFNGKL